MSKPRLVPAPISLLFSEESLNKEAFEREFQQLSESDEDPISQWLKLAKARGETKDTDPVLLQLVVELHRKIDKLEMFLKDEVPNRVSLMQSADIVAIGFEHFEIKEPLLEVGKIYYGRIEMPVYPQRDVGVFFEGVDANLAQIRRMHERDEREWNAYVTARERVLIRESRERR